MRRATSVSPTRPPPTQECLICRFLLGSQKVWTCLQCHMTIHLACYNKQDPLSDENPCPFCRSTPAQVCNALSYQDAAPWGAVCYICRKGIPQGQPMRRCPARRRFCLASFHTKCYRQGAGVPLSEKRCPACGTSGRMAYRERARVVQDEWVERED